MRTAAAPLQCPSAVIGGPGGGDGCGGVAVGDTAGTEVLWMTQPSAD